MKRVVTGLERLSGRELIGYSAVIVVSLAVCFACDWQFWVQRWFE